MIEDDSYSLDEINELEAELKVGEMVKNVSSIAQRGMETQNSIEPADAPMRMDSITGKNKTSDAKKMDDMLIDQLDGES